MTKKAKAISVKVKAVKILMEENRMITCLKCGVSVKITEKPKLCNCGKLIG